MIPFIPSGAIFAPAIAAQMREGMSGETVNTAPKKEFKKEVKQEPLVFAKHKPIKK